MEVIKNYKHTFKIAGNEIELLINYTDGLWKCEIIKGDTGRGTSTGGRFDSLQEYIKYCESNHRYSYNFFNHGYKAAKASIQ